MSFNGISINTLVFIDEMAKTGKKQKDYFAPLAEIGIKIVEVRREMFDNPLEEAKEIKELAEKFDQTLYYSIPLPMYKNGELDKDTLALVAEEAKAMGIVRAKFVVGDYKNVTSEDLSWLVEQYYDHGITLSVENDQTQMNGLSGKIVKFLNSCKVLGAKGIDHTFDIGNWVYVGESPEENAHKLKEYTGYIHLKDVKNASVPITSLINTGDIDWKNIIKILRDKNQPVALEYPCGENAVETLKKELGIITMAL